LYNNIWYKECNVTKEHFGKLETNYYYTYHSNHENNKTISYEVDPIYVILEKQTSPTEDDNSYIGIIIGAAIGGIVLIVLIVVLIWYIRKKRNEEKRDKFIQSNESDVPITSNINSDIKVSEVQS